MFLTIQKMWFATRLAILCKGTVFTLLLAALLSTGCTVVEIKEQTEMLEGASVIHGKIQRATDQQGPLAVMGFELIDGVLSYQALQYTTESGEFHFNATPGIYQVIAFVDVNRDGAYQSNEHAAYHKESPLITVSEGQTIEVEPLVITAEPIEMDQPVDTEIQGSKLYANTGRIISLDDPIFLRENYGVGLWRPMDFINTVGGGLFMLQEYDPDKVPVLFVHGINGGPVDWKVVIDQVDRSKFQPWIYYYPSGLQLDIVSDNLVNAVSKLRERYGYKKLKVVAHSMGGAGRSIIRKNIH
jgi:hypothetical protein